MVCNGLVSLGNSILQTVQAKSSEKGGGNDGDGNGDGNDDGDEQEHSIRENLMQNEENYFKKIEFHMESYFEYEIGILDKRHFEFMRLTFWNMKKTFFCEKMTFPLEFFFSDCYGSYDNCKITL